jgi:hypothetical protein
VVTWREPRRAAPLCDRCLVPMALAGMTLARAQDPPAEVESSVWRCPLCGSGHARPVRCRPLKAGGEGGAA